MHTVTSRGSGRFPAGWWEGWEIDEGGAGGPYWAMQAATVGHSRLSRLRPAGIYLLWGRQAPISGTCHHGPLTLLSPLAFPVTRSFSDTDTLPGVD